MQNQLQPFLPIRPVVFLLFILLLLQNSPVFAETRPTLCNRGEHRLNVADVHDYWVQGTRYWSENGWWTIEAHSCETLPTIPEHRVRGFAFMAHRGGKYIFPTFNPRAANTQGDITSGKICADPDNEFHYPAKSREEIGVRCAAGGFTVPISFFYSTERVNFGKPLIENLTINLEWDYNSLNGTNPRDQGVVEKLSRADAEQAAKDYRHKLFLVAYLDTVYRKKGKLDSDDIYFGSIDLAGHTEIDAYHGLLTQNLEFLKQTYIGPNLRFADKYELRQAMLPGYEIDRGLKPIKLSKLGLKIFDELAEHMGISEQLEYVETFFVSVITNPEEYGQNDVIKRKPSGRRPMLSPEQVNDFLSERAAVLVETTLNEEKLARKKAQEEKIKVLKEAAAIAQKERSRLAEITRAELAAEAAAAAKARAENTKLAGERQALALERSRQRSEAAKAKAAARREQEALQYEELKKNQTSPTVEFVETGKIKKQRLVAPDPEEYKKFLENRLKKRN